VYKNKHLFLFLGGFIMGTVFITTIIASLADSLNPVAITQQMVLQSSTRKKHDILAYIFGIGITNFIFGLIVYFGLADIVLNTIDFIEVNYPSAFPIAAIFIGTLLIGYISYSRLIKDRKESSEKEHLYSKDEKSLSVWSLFGIGVISCVMELTSALPYLAYLTFLIQVELNPVVSIVILIIYNILFNLPLILLYGLSIYFDKYLVKIYARFQQIVAFLIKYIVPLIVVGLSIVLILWGINSF